jgi:hypothetical protein
MADAQGGDAQIEFGAPVEAQIFHRCMVEQ